MKITVCIGSSCHLKGSRQVVERLTEIINKHNLQDKIELVGTFCMGNCKSGVCVTIDEEFFSVTPESVKTFFDTEVLARLK
jgi:NADH:ubiquinone oxidoreductase subunit E